MALEEENILISLSYFFSRFFLFKFRYFFDWFVVL